MKHTIRKGILIKAKQRFVWNILFDFRNKYFTHIAGLNSNKTVTNRPSTYVDNELIAWNTKLPGDIELDRYKGIALNRKLQSVVYRLYTSGTSTWVEIKVEFEVPVNRIHQGFTDRSILKNVMRDNLVWLKTLVEDRFEHIYDRDLFFNRRLDNSYKSIIRVAREATYLS